MTFKKHDSEKPDLAQIPREALWEAARAFMHGERKYGRYNQWQGCEWTRYASAAQRHIMQWVDGEDIDEDTNVNHLGCAIAGLLILLEYQKKGVGDDNRYKP
jgi:hypothetical protein